MLVVSSRWVQITDHDLLASVVERRRVGRQRMTAEERPVARAEVGQPHPVLLVVELEVAARDAAVLDVEVHVATAPDHHGVPAPEHVALLLAAEVRGYLRPESHVDEDSDPRSSETTSNDVCPAG